MESENLMPGGGFSMKRTPLRKTNLKLFLCLLPFLIAMPVLAQDQNQNQGEEPPGRIARLSYMTGSVSFQPSGETQWSDAPANYTLTTGDRLYTNQGARAELEVGPYAVRMSENTDLTVANLNDQLMQLGLGQGSVEVSVYELPENNTVEVDTPNGALTLLRPGSYRVDSDPNNGTLVSVNRGSLEISGGSVSQTLNAGQAAQLTGTNPIQINQAGMPGRDDFDSWCDSRDRRVESFHSRQYVNPYTPGAEDLDQYGQWNTASEYGPVWYPSGVAGDWAPYRNGHWAFVEPWGWTWVEDEPWGFAPFHYGRWAFVGSRWGWVPGPLGVAPIYSPALVAFVGGGGFSVGIGIGGGVGLAAWFPLGPSDPFIPWYHSSPNYIRQVNVTNVRNTTVINNYINNITTNTSNVNVTNIKYAYKTTAVTAVSASAFRGGQSVQKAIVHVTPQQIAQAQVIAHPAIAPTRTSVFAGRTPVKAPPVRAARAVVPPVARVTPGTAAAGARPAPPAAQPQPRVQPPAPARATAPPPGRPTPPAAAEAARPTPERTAPPAAVRNAPRPAPASPPPARPSFVTKTPPPARDVPFAAHQPAYAAHPGRPLEPQQEQNIRAGRPAGPQQDREVLPHAAPPPRPAPREESKPAPPKKEEKH
jgi:hypothetical protein